MAERDRAIPAPATDDALSFDEGSAQLESVLFGGSTEKPAETSQDEAETEAEAPEETSEQEAEPGDEADDEADAEEADEAESEDEGSEDETEEEEGDEATLADDTEIDLGDGQKTTLAELKELHGQVEAQVQKRVADFQRDYTEKTTALAAQRESVERNEARILEKAQTLRQNADQFRAQQDQFLQFVQAQIPPDPALTWTQEQIDEDLYGFNQAQIARTRKIAELQEFTNATEAERQKAISEQQEQLKERQQAYVAEQQRKVLERHPEFADAEKGTALRNEIGRVFTSQYGFSNDELNAIQDSRFVDVMVRLIELEKLAAEVPKAKETAKKKVQGKPKMPPLKSGKRRSHQDRDAQAVQARAKRLRETGTIDDAVQTLLDHPDL